MVWLVDLFFLLIYLVENGGYQTCNMAERCCGYNCVNDSYFESEVCSVHTQKKKKNLGDSLPYLNALVTPESLVCTCLE